MGMHVPLPAGAWGCREGMANTPTPMGEKNALVTGILGLFPNTMGAPKCKRVLLNATGCSEAQWGAPGYDGVLLAVTDARSHDGVLLAVMGCSLPREGAPGCVGVLPAPRGALTPAAPVGEQQARRRELFTAASCSRKLSTSLCAASARCKRAERVSGQATVSRPTLQRAELGSGTCAHLSILLLPPPPQAPTMYFSSPCPDVVPNPSLWVTDRLQDGDCKLLFTLLYYFFVLTF